MSSQSLLWFLFGAVAGVLGTVATIVIGFGLAARTRRDAETLVLKRHLQDLEMDLQRRQVPS